MQIADRKTVRLRRLRAAGGWSAAIGPRCPEARPRRSAHAFDRARASQPLRSSAHRHDGAIKEVLSPRHAEIEDFEPASLARYEYSLCDGKDSRPLDCGSTVAAVPIRTGGGAPP